MFQLRAGTLLALACTLAGCRAASPGPDAAPETRGAEKGAAPSRAPSAPPELHHAPLETLADCVALALERSPTLQSAYADWQAAAEATGAAGRLPNPRVSFGWFVEEVETRVGPMRGQVGVQQDIPWLDRLEGEQDVAALRARELSEVAVQRANELVHAVRRAWYELWWLERAIAITGDSVALLEDFEAVARTRYKLSEAGHPDVIRVQLELGKLEDRLRELVDLRRPKRARLNALLGRDPEAPLPAPEEPPRAAPAESAEALRALALEHNPALRAAEARIVRERRSADVAHDRGLPNFGLGLGYTFVDDASGSSVSDSGKDPLLVSLSIELPLDRGRVGAGVRAARARQRSAMHSKESVALELGALIEEALHESRDAHRRVELFEATLLPKANESLQASLTGFAAGRTDFLALLDTERTLLEFALQRERARTDGALALARLEFLVGSELAVQTAPQPEEAR